jgi:PadR family transcriptional regulator PadR
LTCDVYYDNVYIERGDTVLNMSEMLRGYTDTIILAQLAIRDSYGYEINKKVVEATNGALELKEATLYTTFRRLESGGYIVSYWGDENTGARRRYYSITESGRELLKENIEDFYKVNQIINKLIIKEG